MLRIKNWEELQHFKDRTPPWIKLYRNILDQRDIMMISDSSFRVLIGVWLLASEDKQMEGRLPCIEDIAFRLRKSEKEIIKAIQDLSSFIIDDDIKPTSNRYQVDAPETETETEIEAETKKDIGDFENLWSRYGRIGNKQKALIQFKKLKGVNYEEIIRGHERYAEYCEANGDWYRKQHMSTWLNNRGWESDWTIQIIESRGQSRDRQIKEAAVRGMLRAENPDF